MADLINRQAAIDALERIFDRCEEIEAHLPEGDPDRVGYKMYPDWLKVWKYLRHGSSAQPEIIRCKDCEYGEQDEVGRWFCRSLGCQIGNEDGSGYCADAERRTDERSD